MPQGAAPHLDGTIGEVVQNDFDGDDVRRNLQKGVDGRAGDARILEGAHIASIGAGRVRQEHGRRCERVDGCVAHREVGRALVEAEDLAALNTSRPWQKQEPERPTHGASVRDSPAQGDGHGLRDEHPAEPKGHAQPQPILPKDDPLTDAAFHAKKRDAPFGAG